MKVLRSSLYVALALLVSVFSADETPASGPSRTRTCNRQAQNFASVWGRKRRAISATRSA